MEEGIARGEKLVEAGSYSTEVEASFAQQILAEAGIPARVSQAASGTWLWHVGSALGGVRVLVRERDRLAAAEVLDDQNDSLETAEVQYEQIAAEEEWPEEDEPAESAPDDDAEAVEKDSRRAFNSAVFGLLLFPLLGFTLWSMYLIFRRSLWETDTAARLFRFYVALACNLGAFYLASRLYLW